MIPCVVGHTDEISDILIDVVVFHVHLFDLSARAFCFLSVGVLCSELFQELIPGVLMVRSGWVVGPYSHAVFPVTDLLSCDE